MLSQKIRTIPTTFVETKASTIRVNVNPKIYRIYEETKKRYMFELYDCCYCLIYIFVECVAYKYLVDCSRISTTSIVFISITVLVICVAVFLLIYHRKTIAPFLKRKIGQDDPIVTTRPFSEINNLVNKRCRNRANYFSKMSRHQAGDGQ